MTFSAGTRLGPYEILAPIGAGGMGEVYRARDTRLDRIVAIKVLPGDKVADPERRRRFLQEARLASALNHPNIVTLHDIAADCGIDYLVMEYVQGKSLDRLITPKALPLVEALGYAQQIASALAAAHAAGIVHRDIKAANVIVTTESKVKVLDFGLAKLVECAPGPEGETETQEPALTEAGKVVGTVAYMSPEQATAKPLDHRTDIFSLGVLLYEMLAGRRPFRAKSQVETMHAIIHEPAPPLMGQAPELEEILAKALAKDANDRYQHAGDLGIDLRRFQRAWEFKSLPSMGIPAGVSSRQEAREKRSRILLLATAGTLVVTAGLWFLSILRRSQETSLRPDTRLTQLTRYTGTERFGAISPDGKHFVFVSDKGGQADIWLRQVSGGEPLQITRDVAVESHLVYAPDGESIYFTRSEGAPILPAWEAGNSSIWRIAFLGGTARKVVEGARNPAPAPDNRQLAFIRGNDVEVSNSDGTAARKLYRGKRQLGSLAWSPDGRWLAFTEGALFDVMQIYLLDIGGKTKKPLTEFSSGLIHALVWLPDSRRLLFSHSYGRSPTADSADLGIVSIDGGEPRRLTLNINQRFAQSSLSYDGKRLLATVEKWERELWKVPLGRDPKANGAMASRIVGSSVDPMWAQVARGGNLVLINSGSTGSRNLFSLTLDGSAPLRQITSLAGGVVTHAALSEDTTKVAYSSMEGGNSQIWIANVDGSNPRQITRGSDQHVWPSWSRDGKWVVFGSPRDGIPRLWRVSIEGGEPIPITPTGAIRGEWSPVDDRIAYCAGQSLEVADAFTGQIVLKVPGPGWNWAMPVWSPDGRRFSAVRDDRDFADSLWIVDGSTGEARLAATFSEPFHMYFRAGWDKDGKSLIVNRQEELRHLVLVENFDR